MFLTVKARVKNFLECFLVVQKCPQNAQVTWISAKQIDADATYDANGRLLIRIITDFLESIKYESIATVGEIRVWLRADFQSGSRVLKKVF